MNVEFEEMNIVWLDSINCKFPDNNNLENLHVVSPLLE